MKFTRTKIPDIILCEPTFIGDERGYFVETFRKDLLENFINEKIHFCQDNESKSSNGVLRGLHYQLPPFAQSKLVRVIEGEVLDVVVDVRKKSSTFGQHLTQILSSENKKQLFIPKGFAHGFIVLSTTAVFAYKVDNRYSAKHECGIAFNDPKLNIDWKLSLNAIRYSKKDGVNPSFEFAQYFED